MEYRQFGRTGLEVSAIGFGCWEISGTYGRIDVVQYGWNMFDRRMRREIFPWCTANGVGVMAYGSLAYGMLSGTFHADMEFDEADWRSKRGSLGGLNLFRTMFGPDHFARN